MNSFNDSSVREKGAITQKSLEKNTLKKLYKVGDNIFDNKLDTPNKFKKLYFKRAKPMKGITHQRQEIF